MTRTTRNILIGIAVVVIIWVYFAAVSGGAGATTLDRGPYGCPGDAWGRSSWNIGTQENAPWPTPGIVKWHWDWHGTMCYGHGHFTEVTWNKPFGDTNFLYQWQYHPGDTQIIAGNNSGPYRYRTYRGHFSLWLVGAHLHRWPTMTVRLWANQKPHITTSTDCDC